MTQGQQTQSVTATALSSLPAREPWLAYGQGYLGGHTVPLARILLPIPEWQIKGSGFWTSLTMFAQQKFPFNQRNLFQIKCPLSNTHFGD
jgi:hypothetical protein